MIRKLLIANGWILNAANKVWEKTIEGVNFSLKLYTANGEKMVNITSNNQETNHLLNKYDFSPFEWEDTWFEDFDKIFNKEKKENKMRKIKESTDGWTKESWHALGFQHGVKDRFGYTRKHGDDAIIVNVSADDKDLFEVTVILGASSQFAVYNDLEPTVAGALRGVMQQLEKAKEDPKLISYLDSILYPTEEELREADTATNPEEPDFLAGKTAWKGSMNESKRFKKENSDKPFYELPCFDTVSDTYKYYDTKSYMEELSRLQRVIDSIDDPDVQEENLAESQRLGMQNFEIIKEREAEKLDIPLYSAWEIDNSSNELYYAIPYRIYEWAEEYQQNPQRVMEEMGLSSSSGLNQNDRYSLEQSIEALYAGGMDFTEEEIAALQKDLREYLDENAFQIIDRVLGAGQITNSDWDEIKNNISKEDLSNAESIVDRALARADQARSDAANHDQTVAQRTEHAEDDFLNGSNAWSGKDYRETAINKKAERLVLETLEKVLKK